VAVDARANRCRPAPGIDTTLVRINRADGDFSSTYLEAFGHATWIRLLDSTRPAGSVGVGAGVSWFAPFLFGQLSAEQRALYGSVRARVVPEGMWRVRPACVDGGGWRGGCWASGRARATAEFVLAPRGRGGLAERLSPRVVPYRWSAEASFAADRLLGIGPFVRWVDGQDYYNIGFVNRRRELMFGVMLDMSGPDRVRKLDRRPD
jgi:hypothetical protein